MVTEAQIEHMVRRFLQWRLPENFNPDGGISFKREFNEHTPFPMKHEPVGTNLFDFNQATEMVRHMLEGAPLAAAPSRDQVTMGVLRVDEVAEDELRSRAKTYFTENGWKPGDTLGVHSVIELMTAFASKALQQPPPERCGYPSCGCDFDAVCNTALSSLSHPSSLVPTAERGVKALEWVKDWGGSFEDIPEWSAKTPWGTISASVAGHRTPDDKRYERHEDVPEELKATLIAKAEAAHKSRVLAALTPPIAGTGEEVAWRWRLKYQDRDEWTDWQVTAQRRDYDGPDERIEEQPLYSAASISRVYSRIGVLEHERDQYKEMWEQNASAAHAAVTSRIVLEEKLTEAEAKLAEARKLLEPFAAYIKARDLDDTDIPDPTTVISYATSLRGPVVAVTFGDFRRARSFHSPKEPDGGGE